MCWYCFRSFSCNISWRPPLYFKGHHKEIRDFKWRAYNWCWGLWNCLQTCDGWRKSICLEKDCEGQWGLRSLFRERAWNSWKHQTQIPCEPSRILQFPDVKIVNIWFPIRRQPWWSSSWLGLIYFTSYVLNFLNLGIALNLLYLKIYLYAFYKAHNAN